MSTINLTNDNFDDVVKKHGITVIDFWAEWCGPCKSFAPIFESVATDNPDITFAKVEIDKEKELAAAFNVRSIPLVVVMKQDVVVYSQAGSLPKSALEDLISQARAADVTGVK